MNKYSILHISDIHRGPNSDLNNLYESLVNDSIVYEREGIEKPSIIVVSGDIAEGAEGDRAEAIIKQQYKEAGEFLEKLTTYFLNGEKRRLVMVPGNHDMNREMSKISMSEYELKKDDDPKFIKRQSNKRWSWKNMKFYEITDEEAHAKRFDLFVDFYNSFYGEIRSITGNPETFSDVADLEDYGISFALFNSCYRLDHLRYCGEIYPASVTHLASKLRNLDRKGRLIVGVWHHHTQGLPEEDNYMDYRVLLSLVEHGVHIGLFGHQHFSQIINHYMNATDNRELLLISSGSLYGGHKQLVTGYSRQYNIIEVEIRGTEAEITLNVRKDNQPDYDIPSWGISPVGNANLDGKYRHTIKLNMPSEDEQVLEIDSQAKLTGDYTTALRNLSAHHSNYSRYNDLLDSYLPESNLPREEMIRLLRHPQTEVQALMLLDAVEQSRNWQLVREVLNEPFVKNCKSTMVKEYRDRLQTKLEIFGL